MQRYYLLALGLCYGVNWMLLTVVRRVTDGGFQPVRDLLAALLGALYMSACTVPTLVFLQSLFWRLVSMACVSLAAFGWDRATWGRGFLFCLLQFAVEGTGGENSFLWTVLICGGCWMVHTGQRRKNLYQPVKLCFGGKEICLTALRDTGHDLKDPITGQPVMVVDAQAACRLTGLSPQQLSTPVETMGAIPGLRLIPYKTVGSTGGFLLALPVNVDRQRGRTLVAFAPNVLDESGKFQALIGGTV